MTAYALLFTMAAIGISETVYLIRTRREEDAEVVCPIGGGCHAVLGSQFKTSFGIHNDVLGLVFYTATAILMALVVIESQQMELFVTIAAVMIVGAAVMSLYFVYLQWRVLKEWCFWCMMSALTVLVMLVTTLADFSDSFSYVQELL